RQLRYQPRRGLGRLHEEAVVTDEGHDLAVEIQRIFAEHALAAKPVAQVKLLRDVVDELAIGGHVACAPVAAIGGVIFPSFCPICQAALWSGRAWLRYSGDSSLWSRHDAQAFTIGSGGDPGLRGFRAGCGDGTTGGYGAR